MKRVGIICEFNPLHSGHALLLREVRRAGAQTVVCLMSEYFVQRGDPAVLPARERAAAAVRAGADEVYAFPFPWSCASAEIFARAGVQLLSALGCDTLAFGSESGDLAFLLSLAAEEPRQAARGEGTASAYPRLPPNDILAVSYLRAAAAAAPAMEFFPVKRLGAAHGSVPLPGETDTCAVPPQPRPAGGEPLPELSSSAVRLCLRRGEIPAALPEASAAMLKQAMADGLCPVRGTSLADAELGFWRLRADAGQCAECGGGVAERLHRAACGACSGSEAASLAATKKYTDARLRRASLYGMLGVLPGDLRAAPAYVRLLAFAGAYGGPRRQTAAVPVCQRVREIPADGFAARQFALETQAEALYTLLLPEPRPAGFLLCRNALRVEPAVPVGLEEPRSTSSQPVPGKA